jgi:hypothetical protein
MEKVTIGLVTFVAGAALLFLGTSLLFALLEPNEELTFTTMTPPVVTSDGDDADIGIVTFEKIKPEDQSFALYWGEERAVILRGDGTIEYQGGYAPTEAAEFFWNEVLKKYKSCK